MESRSWREDQRRRTAIAMIISVAVHAAIIGYVVLDVAVFADEEGRQPAAADLAEQYRQRSIDVVQIGETAGGPEASTLASSSAAPPAERPGGPAESVPDVFQPVPPPSSPPADPLNLTLAETSPQPVMTVARASRGVVQRAGASGGTHAVVFQPASEAARDAERRGGGGRGVLDGIGVIIGGSGDDPVCKPARPPRGITGNLPGTTSAGRFRLPRARGGGIVDRRLPGGVGGR